MEFHMKRFLMIIGVLTLTGCVDVVGRDVEIERVAMEFSLAADECLLDVRDRQIPFSNSNNCTKRLSNASMAYVSFSKVEIIYLDEAVPRFAYIAEGAKSVAWSAAALSNARFRNVEPVTSIW